MRIVGVDRVPSTPFDRGPLARKPILTPLQVRTRKAKRALAARGMVEAVTWSFIAKPQAELFGGGKAELALANPIAADLSDMRPSLLPGLIAALQRNADRGYGDVALFEVGQIFPGAGESEQKIAACAVRRGAAKSIGGGRHWAGAASAVDAFDAKSDVLALLAALGAPAGGMRIVPGGPAWFHPGRSASLQFGPRNVIGAFGEIHPRCLDVLGAEGPLVGFELILNDIPAPKSKPTRARAKLDLSEFMPLRRDFAFLADRSVEALEIVKAAIAGEPALVAEASVFDVYEGQGVPEGRKSVAISVTLQPREKTLTEAEIDAASARIIAEVRSKTGATLRG
jgi:phenylalanyl-tRNA synthetase beta chain